MGIDFSYRSLCVENSSFLDRRGLGHRIGLEFADARRFKAGSWQSGPMIASPHEAQVLTQVEQFLTDHPSDYVRLLSIDPRAKQRQLERLIQKPE